MIYLGKDPVGISNVVSTTEAFQSIVTPQSDSQTITFDVVGKPDAFIICLLDGGGKKISSMGQGYGCTSACAIWSNYQGGQWAGGRSTGISASATEDHWQVRTENITYDEQNHTLTFFTNSSVRFISGWTYSLYYVLDHREEVTTNG